MREDTDTRLRHPVTDFLEGFMVGAFITAIESRGIDKNELVAIYFMTQNPIRRDFLGAGLQPGTRSHVLPSEGVDDL
jgi:hypothetical protein